MKKKELTEADIRTKFITPALVGAKGDKWNVMTQLATSRATAANLLSALVAELTGTTRARRISASPVSSTGRSGRPRKS